MGIHGSQKMDKNEDGKFTWRNSIDGDGADGFSKITPFSDIMSEQLMEGTQNDADDEGKNFNHEHDDFQLAQSLSVEPDCSNDEELAYRLQKQFEREDEINRQCATTEFKNGVKKVFLSPESYDSKERGDLICESDDESDSSEKRNSTTSYNQNQKSSHSGSKDQAFTKHNISINSTKTIEQLDFTTHALSDRIYNELKTFGKAEAKRSIRLRDKDEKALTDISVDSQTRLILLKWINNGEFDRVEEVIATGKESAVLHAISDNDTKMINKIKETSSINCVSDDDIEDSQCCSDDEPYNGTHFAIKIYKSSLSSFKNRSIYVKDDFRFKNPRSIMKVWAEKEFLNLKRLRKADIQCPLPIKLRKHALLMSMIGEQSPAPRLKDLEFLDEHLTKSIFEQIRMIINRMYKECKLVHGDLSEFNLLFYNEIVYVIDMAQAVDISHPQSLLFLHRDIKNILDFCDRVGCQNLPTPHELFQEVTGIEFDKDKSLCTQIEQFEGENRNTEITQAKANPADFELILYEKECNRSERDPARPYN